MKLVDLTEFNERTSGGRANQVDMSAWEGLTFECACGETHRFAEKNIQVVRELPQRMVVLSCPNSEAMTCVQLKGGFNPRFSSVSGTYPDTNNNNKTVKFSRWSRHKLPGTLATIGFVTGVILWTLVMMSRNTDLKLQIRPDSILLGYFVFAGALGLLLGILGLIVTLFLRLPTTQCPRCSSKEAIATHVSILDGKTKPNHCKTCDYSWYKENLEQDSSLNNNENEKEEYPEKVNQKTRSNVFITLYIFFALFLPLWPITIPLFAYLIYREFQKPPIS